MTIVGNGGGDGGGCGGGCGGRSTAVVGCPGATVGADDTLIPRLRNAFMRYVEALGVKDTCGAEAHDSAAAAE